MRKLWIISLILSCTTTAPVDRGPKLSHTEIVQVHQIDGRVSRRHKRSLLIFPKSLVMNLENSDNSLDVLHLERTEHMLKLPPLITLTTNGNFTKTNIIQENFAFYQDPIKTAAIMVKCPDNDINNIQMHGTYLKEGQLYEIKPATKNNRKQNRYKREDHFVTKIALPMDLSDDFLRINTSQLRISQNEMSKSSPRSMDSQETNSRNNIPQDEVTSGAPERSLFIEYLVVTDFASFKQWAVDGESNEEIEMRMMEYYAQTINGMDIRFRTLKDETNEIRVVFAGLIVSNAPEAAGFTENHKTCPYCGDVDALATLRDFNSWHHANIPNIVPHDHAALFTGFNLLHPASGARTVDLAYLDSMCSGDSVSVIEEVRGALDIHTASHELGHCIGSDHDGYRTAIDCDSEESYLMSPKVKRITDINKSSHPWIFSECSKNDIFTFVDQLDTLVFNCLLNEPLLYIREIDSTHGQVYKADVQCSMSIFAESTVCREEHYGDWSSLCYGMACRLREGEECEWILPQDGTPCGHQKWCQQGRCVHSEDSQSLPDMCPLLDDPGFDCDIEECDYYSTKTREVSCCGTCQWHISERDDIKVSVPKEDVPNRIKSANEEESNIFNNISTSHPVNVTLPDFETSTTESKISQTGVHFRDSYKLDFKTETMISLYLAAMVID